MNIDKSKKTNMNIVYIFSVFYILLIMIGGFNHSKGMFSLAGYLSIGSVILIGCFIFIINFLKDPFILKKEKWIYIYSVLFIGIYILSTLFNFSSDAVLMAVQISMVILYFWGVVFFPFNSFNFMLSYYLIIVYFSLNFIWWGLDGFKLSFSGIMNNPNPFGAFIATFLGLFLIVKNKYRNANKFLTGITICMGIMLLYASESRAAWLIILASICTYYAWPAISKKRLFFNLLFLLIFFIIYLITILYPKLLYSPIGYTLQEISRQYTGKNFFSGRQILWNEILTKISEKPLLGYGASSRPEEFLDATLSAHNYYLQMGLQVGIIGTLIFLLFLFSIWQYLYNARKIKIVRLVGALFTGIIFYQIFEVSFTQNILSVSIIQWLIIGIGVHYTRHELIKNK